jgi:PAS domain S-box-containing protein
MIGGVVSFRDITERKQAAEALRESEQRFMDVLYSSPDAVLLIDGEQFVDCNEATARMLGYADRNEFLMTHPSKLSPPTQPDGRNSFEKANEMMRIANEKGFHQFEWEHRRANGEDFLVEVSLTVIVLHGKNVIHCMWRDLTERKRAAEALRASEELFRSYLEYAPDGVYMNDLEGNFLYGNIKCEEIIGYQREELIGKNFLELNILSENSLDKAVQLVQANMEGRSTGPDEVDLIRKDGRLIPVEINTNVVQRMDQRIVLSFVRDISDRKRAEDELQQTLNSLRKAFGTTIQVMVSAVETRDPYTAGHQSRSADLAIAIATEMGLPREKIEAIRMAGPIHDIGKLSIPAEILSKPTKLTDLEFSLIKEHSRSGYEILKDVESPWPLAEIVYQHHERMDGSGYPRNLKGEEIIMEARIMTVADVVEAMASHRPYRPGLGIDAALEEIEKNRGTHYDNTVVDACLRLFREKGYQLEGA